MTKAMMFFLGMRGKWKSENEDEVVVTAYPLLPYKMVPANTVWEILERLGGGLFDYSKTELRRMTGDRSVSPATIFYEEMMIDEYLIIMEMELRPGSTNVETAFPNVTGRTRPVSMRETARAYFNQKWLEERMQEFRKTRQG